MGRKFRGPDPDRDNRTSLQVLGFIVFIIGFGIGISSVVSYLFDHFGTDVEDVLPQAKEVGDSAVVSQSSPIVALILVVFGIILIAAGSKDRP